MSEIITACIFAVIIILNIAGTIFVLMQKGKETNNPLKYFSLLTNIRKLFTTKKDGFDKASNLNVFSGVRALMMFCVIYGHTGGL